MTSRKWVYLFLSTLFIGGVASVLVGFIVRWTEYISLFQSADIKEIVSVTLWLLGVGFIFSLISQMGFFAYLTVHRFGLGIFRSVSLWNAVQLVLIAFVFFDFIYLRYNAFATENEALFPYVWPALVLLLLSVIVAFIKMKETNKGAFVPAIFFMFVITIIEWFPALRANDEGWLYFMVLPLFICNAWQLLMLHRLTNADSKG